MGKWLRLRLWYPALARLPLPVGYALAAISGIGEILVDQGGRRAVAEGLRCLLPGLSLLRRAEILVRHFVMKSWECLDAFVLMVDARRAASLVHVSGLEILRQARLEGAGVILVMAHFGRINLHALGLARAGERLGMLTMAIDNNPDLDTVERDYLRAKAAALHRHLGGSWIRLGGSLRQLYRDLARREVVVILLDAYVPGWEKRAVKLPCFGGRLALPTGILRLAQRTGARLVYAGALQKGFRVRGYLKPLPSEPEAGFQAALCCLEQDISRFPWLWWQWNLVPQIFAPAESQVSTI
jgi:KDO2-lipid IV(A) lauroyltransferase